VTACSITQVWGGGGEGVGDQFTSAGRTFVAWTVSSARQWIWGSQCLWQLPLQVVDDDLLEVVDVLLIGINSWWIHPLWETAFLCSTKGKKTLETKDTWWTHLWTLLTHAYGQCQKRRPELFHPSYTCIKQNSPCEHLGHNTICFGA
jgi:hypothetical protein